MKPTAIYLALAVLIAPAPAWAGNEPEKAQRRIEEDVLPKIVLACGLPLSVAYDGASLRKNNKDIGYDTTDGANECDEPLRYLWYACGTAAGKAAVKAARISKVVCKGTAGATGSLTGAAGTITVERAYEESKPYLRSRKQFEALLKVTLKIPSDDPYNDEAWHALPSQPNPVTSTTTFCLVNGTKAAFNENVYDPFTRRKEDANIKCWKDGEIVVELDIRKGRKTGFLTHFNDRGSRRTAYRDDRQQGEERQIENGKLASLTSYDGGERVWEKELYPNGALKHYRRKFADGYGELSRAEDGKLYQLGCSPGARDDKELHQICGFNGPVTTAIYDGTGKVSRVDTWKDGVIQKQGAGSSDYGSRSEVAFKDGKKQGEERVLGRDGKLAAIINWDRGVKEGREVSFADGGRKVAKEIVWKAGEIKQVTQLYLNGNPSLKESYEGPKRKQVQVFWDTGKVQREGTFVLCDLNVYGYEYRDWCEDGVHRSYYENGGRQAEVSFRLGKREGPSQSWWENGKPESVEAYANDKLAKAKRWDKDGKLLSDDEFEPDGSRKLKR